jgi:hypothetical protein
MLRSNSVNISKSVIAEANWCPAVNRNPALPAPGRPPWCGVGAAERDVAQDWQSVIPFPNMLGPSA